MKLKFKKVAGLWFIDYPEYIEKGGFIHDLQMVDGADTFLDCFNENNKDIVEIEIHSDYYNNQTYSLIKMVEDRYGATYGGLIGVLNKNIINWLNQKGNLWLCDVTKEIFGNFPEKIIFEVLL